jgi:hypothetical protein
LSCINLVQTAARGCRLAQLRQERERERFMDLADRLTRSTDPADQKRLKEELARLTFGD